MKLKNSYIFLNNPHKKQDESFKKDENGVINFVLGKNLYSYLEKSFPEIKDVARFGNIFKRKYCMDYKNGNFVCNVEFIISEVDGIEYLDVIVGGNTKIQIIKVLENIQKKLVSSGILEK